MARLDPAFAVYLKAPFLSVRIAPSAFAEKPIAEGVLAISITTPAIGVPDFVVSLPLIAAFLPYATLDLVSSTSRYFRFFLHFFFSAAVFGLRHLPVGLIRTFFTTPAVSLVSMV